ncbi:MAG: hypothetical protein KF789_15275 [Bdellovibrionaceae bacterium]|nr:hypothetical protein [Pseudobdellovibrionaceae bacterium]
MKSALVAFVFGALFAVSAQAQERREFYNGIRSLGMGGVSVATVNDETALLLNPAALGRLRDFYGTILDPEIEFNNHVSPMRREKIFNGPFSIKDISQVALDNPGKQYHARAQIFPSFVGRNFGIGLLGRYVLDMRAIDPQTIETFHQDDLALVLGYNLRLWGGRLKIGFSGKVISRLEVNDDLDSALPLDNGSLASAGTLREGVGVSTDIGVQLTAPWKLLPTLGAVLRDVGGTSFDKMTGFRGPDTTERPSLVRQDLDVGLSISPIHSNGVRSQWSIEYKGLLSASDVDDKAKLMHFGGELNFGDRIFLRAGYHQRYWTAGLEIASERLQFQISSHGEEVGVSGAPREDRRVAAKLAVRF